MNHKEVLELKRRLKKESCSIDRVCGCYVNAGKEKVTTFGNTMLNLEDEEFFKFLEIANKCLSGKINNNLMNLEYTTEAELNGEEHKILMSLRESRLRDDAVLDAFYDHVIETFDYVGNYLIVLFHDVYDVPTKTTDNLALDESEVVYDHILCAICPVDLSKPGLSYRTDKDNIGARERDWVVGAVNTGFLFPAFNDRSADIHSILCYTKNAKEPHTEFWVNGLGVEGRYTSDQKRTAFEQIVAGPSTEDDNDDTLLDIQETLSEYIAERECLGESVNEDLDKNTVVLLLEASGVSEKRISSFEQKYEEVFKDDKPNAKDLLDEKTIKNNELRIENRKLQEEINKLKKKLSDHGIEVEED